MIFIKQIECIFKKHKWSKYYDGIQCSHCMKGKKMSSTDEPYVEPLNPNKPPKPSVEYVKRF